LRLFVFFVLPNTQAFAARKKTKNHQKSLFFKNQALYGHTLISVRFHKKSFYNISPNGAINQSATKALNGRKLNIITRRTLKDG